MRLPRADIVTVYHNEKNHAQHKILFDSICEHEPGGGYRLIGVDNRIHNRGFAAACNLGAFHPKANAPIIGFLNPDAVVHGPFLDQVESVLANTRIVITGNRYGKSQNELRWWGVTDWVCGACMFVSRKWFTSIGGIDEQFVWSHDDTDLVRTAESTGLMCASTNLPITHDSPTEDTPEDAAYKRHHFEVASRRYRKKWGT